MTGTSFTGNSAGAGGGGLYNYDSAQVTRDTFTGNTAPVGGGMENAWSAVVAESTFHGNSAGSDGGGLYNDCEARVSGSTFTDNQASSDGGALDTTYTPLAECFAATFVHLTGGQVRHNTAGADGGGIFNSGDSGVSLSGTAVTGNHPDNCVPLGSVPGCTG